MARIRRPAARTAGFRPYASAADPRSAIRAFNSVNTPSRFRSPQRAQTTSLVSAAGLRLQRPPPQARAAAGRVQPHARSGARAPRTPVLAVTRAMTAPPQTPRRARATPTARPTGRAFTAGLDPRRARWSRPTPASTCISPCRRPALRRCGAPRGCGSRISPAAVTWISTATTSTISATVIRG